MDVSLIHLVGETIVVTYVADPVVSRGQFRLENHGTSAAFVAVESAWVRMGGRQQPLPQVFLFDVDADQQLDPSRLRVAPGQQVTFLLGFAGVPYLPPADDVVVGLRLSGPPASIEAESPVQFVRRIPRG